VIQLSDLLGSEVVTESGEPLAQHVWEVRAERADGALRLVGLLVGRVAFFERMGLRHALGQPRRRTRTRPDRSGIPWEAVVRVEPGRIVVRDGTRPREL
jgi:sporulation protein YlmC with PRC-barrel domain